MKIIKQELQFEECLKQRLEFICEFSKFTPTFINGSIRKSRLLMSVSQNEIERTSERRTKSSCSIFI